LPSQNFVGADVFSYCVTDGKATSAVATVTINVVGGGDSSGCPECLAQLEPVIAARGGSLSALLSHVVVPENSTCLESELIQFYTVAKTLGHVNDSQLNAAINSTASCLGANLEAELIKRQTKSDELLPSKWSVLVGKRVMAISNQLQQAAGLTDASAQTKKFLSAAAALRYVDKYVASGQLAPAVISNKVYWCRFTISGQTVQRVLKLNDNGWFTLKDMDGNTVAFNFYAYERTAFDSGTFQLLLDGVNVTTLNFKFGPTRGKISGDMRGWFTPQ